MKKLLTLTLALAMTLSLAACGNGNTSTPAPTASKPASSDSPTTSTPANTAAVTINVGYENAVTEPAAQACEKWKELVAEKSNGTINLELFPCYHPGQEERPD